MQFKVIPRTKFKVVSLGNIYYNVFRYAHILLQEQRKQVYGRPTNVVKQKFKWSRYLEKNILTGKLVKTNLKLLQLCRICRIYLIVTVAIQNLFNNNFDIECCRDAPNGKFAGYRIPDGTGWHQPSGSRIPDRTGSGQFARNLSKTDKKCNIFQCKHVFTKKKIK